MKTQRIVVPALICLASAGFFPILNFTPNHPVVLSWVTRVLLLGLAFLCCTELSRLERLLFPGWRLSRIALFNLSLSGGGLLFRYLLEFGEISNVYNFTPVNVLFHLLFMTLLASLSTLVRRRAV